MMPEPRTRRFSSRSIVLIFSSVFGEHVLLAGTDADVDAYRRKHPALPPLTLCYRGRELKAVLACTDDEELRLLHETKRLFPHGRAHL